MKNTHKKLIIISFALALIASIAGFTYLQSLKEPTKVDSNKITILVANQTIPPRTMIEKGMIKELEVTDDAILGDYLTDYSAITGKYTNETIYTNEGFRKEKLMEKNQEEISLRLKKNYRAVSLRATPDSAVANLLLPGDFVDLVVYLSEIKEGTEIIRPDIAKIFLQKVEILAIDRIMNRDEGKGTGDQKPDKEVMATSIIVTLSIPVEDIEKLALAENIGNIKLALRPLKDEGIIQTESTVWPDLIINSSDEGETDKEVVKANLQGFTLYTVKPGDTLKKISQSFYGTPEFYPLLKEANNIKDENIILTGITIKIPIVNQ